MNNLVTKSTLVGTHVPRDEHDGSLAFRRSGRPRKTEPRRSIHEHCSTEEEPWRNVCEIKSRNLNSWRRIHVIPINVRRIHNYRSMEANPWKRINEGIFMKRIIVKQFHIGEFMKEPQQKTPLSLPEFRMVFNFWTKAFRIEWHYAGNSSPSRTTVWAVDVVDSGKRSNCSGPWAGWYAQNFVHILHPSWTMVRTSLSYCVM